MVSTESVLYLVIHTRTSVVSQSMQHLFYPARSLSNTCVRLIISRLVLMHNVAVSFSASKYYKMWLFFLIFSQGIIVHLTNTRTAIRFLSIVPIDLLGFA